MLRRKHEIKKLRRKRSCLFASAKKTKRKKQQQQKKRQSLSVRKNFARCGPKNFPRATKARISVVKKCGWKNLQKNENAMFVSRFNIRQSCCNTRREKMMENTVKNPCMERLKGTEITSGETLVEKLDEAVFVVEFASRKRKLRK